MIGETINNRFTILSLLGEGGMGEVYLASDQKTSQQVAIKILARQLSTNPESLERFRREAETLRQLDHPNIVKFIDAFSHEGQYVIVMEYVPGGSLHELIKKGPLPIERAHRIALELCDALIRSHHLNIIHRDLKPENVLLNADGKPKLADFGVARLEEGTRMTRTGTQVGTPYYMAPEAWGGKPLDAQADIWSLGIMLFEMLAGRVPFNGDTPLAVMSQVSTAELPNLRKLRSDTPSGLVNIIKRMLARDKKRRYGTMREVAVDLEREQQKKTAKPASNETSVRRISIGNRKTSAVLIGGVVILAIAGGFPYISEILAEGQEGRNTPTAYSTSTIERSENTPTREETPTAESEPTTSRMTSDKDGMVIVLVPGGEFTMGSDDGTEIDNPIHTVLLDAFWMDQTEVTNGKYAMCVSDGECSPPSDTKSPTRSSYFGNAEFDDFPVVNVDWYMASAYCEWAGRRLPTEAEWEKSARGTDERLYPWGNIEPNDSLLNFNSPSRDTTIVGAYPDGRSPYGIFDLAGNVWEWVHDIYDSSYYRNSPRSNPSGPDSSGSGTDFERVLRGGSWYYVEGSVRSIFRFGVIPVDVLVRSDTRSFLVPDYEDTGIFGKPPLGLGTVGFRCAMDVAP